MDTTVGISVVSFLVILAVLVLLRSKNSRFEIKPTDIIVSILPILVFLLVSGKLQKFEVSESGIKIETAFVKAQAATIASQVTPLRGLPSEPITVDPKQRVSDISRLINRKTEGLMFRLGQGNYWGPAIEEYVFTLTRKPFLKYLILENPDGTFFALADAREFAALLQSADSPYTAQDFAEWVNSENKAKLAQLPGFISDSDVVTQETDKGQALRKMESLQVDKLPVINAAKNFAGMIDRSRLTASLLIDVSENLNVN